MRASTLVLPLLLAACGTAPAAPAVAPVAGAKPPLVAQIEAPRPPKGALFRQDVDAVIDSGFPRFLQLVDVEPRLVDGQFRGWSIVNLSPRDFWSGVDLKPGDIVTSVNGAPIERDTEAYDVFESLKQAGTLRVAFQRDGQPHTLEYRIVQRSN